MAAWRGVPSTVPDCLFAARFGAQCADGAVDDLDRLGGEGLDGAAATRLCFLREENSIDIVHLDHFVEVGLIEGGARLLIFRLDSSAASLLIKRAIPIPVEEI
jgi:hypothetical protein